MLRNKKPLDRPISLTRGRSAQIFLLACLGLALTSCDKIGRPYAQEGWATKTIPADFCADIATSDKNLPTFSRCKIPSRDLQGNIVQEGRTLEVGALEQGRHAYMHYCYACHGVNGDGKGPAAAGLRPPPRDFRIHSYKFAAVKEGLPNDWDFERIIKGGLHGSAMLEWDIPQGHLSLIIDFIKTFPPPPCEVGPEPVAASFADKKELEKAQSAHRDLVKKCAEVAEKYPNGAPNLWQERYALDTALFASGKPMKIKLAKSTGAPIWVPEVDPWAGKIEEALALGKELYHVRAQCANCHPGYVTKQEFAKLLNEDNPTFRTDLYFSTVIPPTNNLYGVNIMPPDFTMNPVRSIRSREREGKAWVDLDEVRELWRLIASGIGGTGMPSWKGSIKDDEIWALAHYVKWLMDLRMPENKAGRKALHDALANQAPFQGKAAPPPPPEPEPAPEPEEKDGEEDPDAAASAAPDASAAPKTSAEPKTAPAPKAPEPKAAPKPKGGDGKGTGKGTGKGDQIPDEP